MSTTTGRGAISGFFVTATAATLALAAACRTALAQLERSDPGSVLLALCAVAACAGAGWLCALSGLHLAATLPGRLGRLVARLADRVTPPSCARVSPSSSRRAASPWSCPVRACPREPRRPARPVVAARTPQAHPRSPLPTRVARHRAHLGPRRLVAGDGGAAREVGRSPRRRAVGGLDPTARGRCSSPRSRSSVVERPRRTSRA
ncbi:hypothetical protein [Janibacter melonis]|uniref:hypothetical protein n=1 Tax=Janibacter melonis TaxID=262209 RepID=UPI002095EC25|nr:hypothetical protein [Janibacter melonis]